MSYAAHLRTLLRPLGVYELSAHSLSGAELEALGEAFDALEAAIGKNLRESLPVTAQDEGLRAYETLLGYPLLGLSAEGRSAAVLNALRQNTAEASPACLQQAAAFLGGHIRFEEDDLPEQLTVVLDQELVPRFRPAVERYLRSLLPAHLPVRFRYA